MGLCLIKWDFSHFLIFILSKAMAKKPNKNTTVTYKLWLVKVALLFLFFRNNRVPLHSVWPRISCRMQ